MTTDEKALKLHADLKGKLSTEAKYHVKTREDFIAIVKQYYLIFKI